MYKKKLIVNNKVIIFCKKMSQFIYLHHPFTMLIAGPTGSGKTHWVKRLLDDTSRFCKPAPVRITYCYGEYQSIFSTFKNTSFIQGILDIVMMLVMILYKTLRVIIQNG